MQLVTSCCAEHRAPDSVEVFKEKNGSCISHNNHYYSHPSATTMKNVLLTNPLYLSWSCMRVHMQYYFILLAWKPITSHFFRFYRRYKCCFMLPEHMKIDFLFMLFCRYPPLNTHMHPLTNNSCVHSTLSLVLHRFLDVPLFACFLLCCVLLVCLEKLTTRCSMLPPTGGTAVFFKPPGFVQEHT